MSKKVKAIPDGFHTITPFLSFNGAAKAIQFYEKAFDAKVIEKHDTPDGKVMHAILQIGDSLLMIADQFPDQDCGIKTPHALKGTTALFHLYVPNVDASFDRAIKAGATVNMPLADMFWGDRYGQIQDPFGHIWSLATHIADYTPEEMEKGAQECFSSQKK